MMRRLLPTLMIAAGLLLMGMKIISDREPGGIPLMLVAVGTVWLILVRSRRESRHSGRN